MDHAVTVRFREARAELIGDGSRFGFRQRSGLKTFGEGFALKKLHAKKIDLALRGEGGVDIENLAHVGMANRARVPHLRGQSVAEARLCALYVDARWQTWIQSFIQGFVDDAHPADRKSTRLNSSHLGISYAVFCLKRYRDHRDLHSFPTRRSSDLFAHFMSMRGGRLGSSLLSRAL